MDSEVMSSPLLVIVGTGIPFAGIALPPGGHFLWYPIHGNAHVDRFRTAHIVFWFLQIEEQGIICTHDFNHLSVTNLALQLNEIKMSNFLIGCQ